MFSKLGLLSSLLAAGASAQQVGVLTTENHPSLPIQQCTAGGCSTLQTKVTLDANWRWLHKTSEPTNCYSGNTWDATLCPDGKTCASNCALDGADYTSTYGVTASGGALTLKFVTNGPFSRSVGSRLYLMASDTKYQMFKLLNKEFTFDVDASQLPCGLNGALYFIEMDEDGGMSKYPTNKAGAKYGTGYCDTQCPHDIKFINGEANSEGWTPSKDDVNAGAGKYGSCCAEMDIWEANSISTAYTPHVCSVTSATRCSGIDCGDGDNRYKGICDKDGCDFNSFRMGDKSFYGPGQKVDSTKKITVVTQFITADGTDTGRLTEIRRKYVQNGVVIDNSVSKIAGVTESNKITDSFCNESKKAFGDNNHFSQLGGLNGMGGSLGRGMVLALSVWDDYAVNMLWLDSTFPTTADPNAPGVARGTCPIDSGRPKELEMKYPDAQVIYSNIKFGAIGSTFSGSTGGNPPISSTTTKPATTISTSTTKPTTQPTTSPGGAALYGQCGGAGHTGPTTCAQGTCVRQSEWYSQCLP